VDDGPAGANLTTGGHRGRWNFVHTWVVYILGRARWSAVSQTRTVVSVIIAAALLAGGCVNHRTAAPHRSTTTTAATGILTGTAQACAGLNYAPTAHLQVYRGQVLVASQKVPTDSTYRFVLRAGHYDITNTGTPDRGSAHPVTVTAGHASGVYVPNECM
jgi:hypothetical protein